MAHAAWPTADEVETFIENQGLTAPADAQLTIHIETAVEEFEQRTGWLPFLAVASASYRYDPPKQGDFLSFEGGMVSVTEIRKNITPTDATGTVLTAEEDYRLWPYNAASRNRPYLGVEFVAGLGSQPKSVKITGSAGFSATIPDDVWSAIRARASALAFAEVVQGIGVPLSIKQGEVEIDYDSQAGRSKTATWNSEFDSAVKRYARAVL